MHVARYSILFIAKGGFFSTDVWTTPAQYTAMAAASNACLVPRRIFFFPARGRLRFEADTCVATSHIRVRRAYLATMQTQTDETHLP